MSAPVARAAADLRLLRAAVFTAVCVTLSAAGHVFASGQGLPLWTLGAGFAAILALTVPLAGRERSLPGIAAVLALGQLALHLLFSCGQAGRTGQPVPRTGGTGTDSGGLLALAAQLLCNERATASLTEAEARRIVTDAGLSDAAEAAARTGHAAAGGTVPGGAVPSFADILGGTPAECLQVAVRTALSLLSAPMLFGHLLAALAAGWLLRRGDAALWRLVRLSADLTGDVADGLLVRALRTALRWVRVLCRGLLPDGDALTHVARADGSEDPVPPHSLVPRHSVIRRGPPHPGHDLALAA